MNSKTDSNKTPSSPKNSDLLQQMELIRKWSEVSGMLHSAQVAHLKLYWAILTDSVGGQIAADLPNKIIEFRSTFKGKVDPHKVPSFKEGIRFILGDGWVFRYKKGKRYFDID